MRTEGLNALHRATCGFSIRTLRLQIARSRYYLSTLDPKVGTVCILGVLGEPLPRNPKSQGPTLYQLNLETYLFFGHNLAFRRAWGYRYTCQTLNPVA